MSIIYEPNGRAREYSYLAINHLIGCLHGCPYCYARDIHKKFHQKRAGHPFDVAQVRQDVLPLLRKQAPKFAGTCKRVLLCFMTDPYQPSNVYGMITREVIKILRSHDIPFQILTKGGVRAVTDFDLYGEHDAFATTMTWLDDEVSLKFEPGAAVPTSRLAAIRIAKEKFNIETWVSLEPVMDPDHSLGIIRRTHEFVDLYKIGKLNHQKSGTNWAEFASAAIELCEKYGKEYYIKNDLIEAAGLHPSEYTNTDTRMINRKAGE